MEVGDLRVNKHRFVVQALAVSLLLSPCFAKSKKPTVPTLRWQQDGTGCSIDVDKADKDTLDRYIITTAAFRISLAVDPRELTVSQHRADHVVGMLLSVHNNGAAPLLVKQSDASLEFVKHSQWRFTSWDADALADRIQDKTDSLMHQTDKDLEKRPAKVEKNEERLREHQKLVSEMVDFLSTQGLKDTTLNAATPEVAGWIFFPSRGKWVGNWKKREEFVFRIPINGLIVEFPFLLPPANRPTLQERPD
jgi:hypothetical protein